METGNTPNATYSIDGIPQKNDAEGQESLLFQSGVLASGNHTLLIDILTDGGQYVLDYAAVVEGNSAISPSRSTTVYAAATSSATSRASQIPVAESSSSTNSSQTGPIVGGVVGGLCLIALLIIGSLVLRKWRKGWKEQMPTHRNSGEPEKYTTFRLVSCPSPNTTPIADQKASFAVTPPSEAASSISEYKSETESVTGKQRYLRAQTTSYQSTASASSCGLEYVDDPSGSTHLEMRQRSPGGV